ncbi:hypothetical protein MBLNU230_g2562t1 [Neophaeotheca triangularis]
MCRDDGKIAGDGLVMMFAEDDFLLTSVPGVTWAAYQHEHGRRKFDCTVEFVTKEWYLLQIQGPRSIEVMEEATGETITDLEFLDAKEMSIDGMKFLALRQGVSGEHGYELWGAAKDGQKVWKAIVATGEKFGIRQLGMRTKLVNHSEAAFPTPSIDFLPAFSGVDVEMKAYTDFLSSKIADVDLAGLEVMGNWSTDPAHHERDPFELGWGWLVKFEHDFIGKEALQKIAADPPRKFVALEWNSEDVADVFASHFREETFDYMEMPRSNFLVADGVFVEDSLVGCAMSRCYSYWFKKMISHAIIDTKHSQPGTEVKVKWGSGDGPQKLIRAVVHHAPYKEDKRRKPVTLSK